MKRSVDSPLVFTVGVVFVLLLVSFFLLDKNVEMEKKMSNIESQLHDKLNEVITNISTPAPMMVRRRGKVPRMLECPPPSASQCIACRELAKCSGEASFLDALMHVPASQRPFRLVVVVGADETSLALSAAKMGYHVVIIEPSPPKAAKVRKALKAGHLNNVALHQVMLGNLSQPATVNMWYTDDGAALRFVPPTSSSQSWINGTIKALSLEELLLNDAARLVNHRKTRGRRKLRHAAASPAGEAAVVDFLFVDMHGMETSVLHGVEGLIDEGAVDTIFARYSPQLMVNAASLEQLDGSSTQGEAQGVGPSSPQSSEVLRWLCSKGFSLFKTSLNSALQGRRDVQRSMWWDLDTVETMATRLLDGTYLSGTARRAFQQKFGGDGSNDRFLQDPKFQQQYPEVFWTDVVGVRGDSLEKLHGLGRC